MCKKAPPPTEIKALLSELIENDPDVKKLMAVSFQETVVSTYQSQLPKSQELKQLEKIRPGITEEMLTIMKEYQKHEIHYDKEILRQEDRRLDIIDKDITTSKDTTLREHIIGASIVGAVLFLSWTLITGGNPISGTTLILGAGGLSTLISRYHTSGKQEESDTKEESE